MVFSIFEFILSKFVRNRFCMIALSPTVNDVALRTSLSLSPASPASLVARTSLKLAAF